MAAIIFDFDGTIADSFDYVADFLAAGVNLSPLNAEQKQALRSRSMIAMARQLGYGWWRLPRLFYKGRRQMSDAIKHIHPFDDMPALIKKLHADGHQLFILSSNTAHNVAKFLRQHELHEYFLEINGNIGMFGKASALRRLLRAHHLKAKDTVYIGDELRDVQAAQSLNLPVVAVTWGFARPNDLTAQHPSAIAHTPSELMLFLKKTVNRSH
jgi:phosphoglycolate phosphatase